MIKQLDHYMATFYCTSDDKNLNIYGLFSLFKNAYLKVYFGTELVTKIKKGTTFVFCFFSKDFNV